VIVKVLRLAVASAPITEIAIGVALWVRPLRRAALGAVLVVHLAAVLFLGPLGHNFNWVVWPWNLAMIVLVWVLFAADTFWQARDDGSGRHSSHVKEPKARRAAALGPGITQTFAELRRSKTATVVVALFSFLPILSYAGWWDSYFSFALYSGNTANANIFISEPFGARLPPKIGAYVLPFRPDYDREHQGPRLLNFTAWAYEEMHVLLIPEPRNFRCIFQSLQKYSREPGDLRLIVGTRTGQVIFYEGDRGEILPSKP
jgi:hypothetical protein